MELSAKNAVILPEGVFIIGSYDENGVPNAMNAAWGVQSDWTEITLILGEHKTTENILKTGAFTVAFGTKDTALISDYFGMETGHRVNKIEKAGCHTRPSEKVNAPIIEEYPLTLECTLKSWDPESGRMIGEIVGQYADERILTDGKVDVEKMELIIFDPASHGTVFCREGTHSSTFSLESIRLVRMPRISAQATVRICTAPKVTTMPPTPVMKMMEALVETSSPFLVHLLKV